MNLFLYLQNIIRSSKALKFLIAYEKKMITELPENIKYLLNEIPGKTDTEKIQNFWSQIQASVDNIFNANHNNLAKLTRRGVKQIIEKKEGLMRSNLMGKRVDQSARSVAAPDPMLDVDQVGVPLDFAKKLTYPVPVTLWNVNKLREYVINGPNVHPGAVFVVGEDGRKTNLKFLDETQRTAIANSLSTKSKALEQSENKIVYRHLINDDYVLMNRQPTLHKPSIQAHRARVMPKDRVLRMPYANCKAYNADFDGDELNLHFPQNECARSESKFIITTKNQYLTPKDGTPLAGLIQDCVVASVMLTMRGNFYEKDDYQQLVFNALSDTTHKIYTPPPSILKPKQLWSGKQVISAIVMNIIPKGKAKPTFNFKTTVKVQLWQTEPPRPSKGGGDVGGSRENMTESEFIMRDGNLLCGVIDKCAIGSSSYGLIHTCYDLYGGDVATRLLSCINRLCTYFLQWNGHSISVKEFITPESVCQVRREKLKALVENAPELVGKKLDLPKDDDLSDYIEKQHMSGDEKELAMVDAAYTSVLNPTVSSVTEENEGGLYRRALDNHMKMMVDTGSKGSRINMNQMASLFGSVAIDGKRMTMSITGKTLPSFKGYEVNPQAGGFIPKRFMTGMSMQNYFFLCVVGRDSLQHTAVKTANSGYMQRCLIKHLEGISVNYDSTVRNSDGLVLQFEFGEDGQDVNKVPFLKSISTMDCLVDNLSRMLDERTKKIALSTGDSNKIKSYKKKLRKWKEKNKEKKTRNSPFINFSSKISNNELEKFDLKSKIEINNKQLNKLKLQKMWHNLTKEEKKKYEKNCKSCPDPIASVYSGNSHLGVISEAMDSLIEEYYEKKFSKRRLADQLLTKDEVLNTVHIKALYSRIEPGEAVGAVCAQAIGEPLTQMTLNTFHFAGRDEMNVTQGVPRMIEILRTASENISTPIMEVPFRSYVTSLQAEIIRISFSEVSLANVLHKINIEETNKLMNNQPCRYVKIRMFFLPYKQYKQKYYVKPPQILQRLEDGYFKLLKTEINKSFNKTENKLW